MKFQCQFSVRFFDFIAGCFLVHAQHWKVNLGQILQLSSDTSNFTLAFVNQSSSKNTAPQAVIRLVAFSWPLIIIPTFVMTPHFPLGTMFACPPDGWSVQSKSGAFAALAKWKFWSNVALDSCSLSVHQGPKRKGRSSFLKSTRKWPWKRNWKTVTLTSL